MVTTRYALILFLLLINPYLCFASKSEVPFFGAKVYRYTLPNKLKVLVLPDHSSPTFSYHTWFNVGSRDEEKGLTGLAHLFEHMMFKATKHYPDGHFDRVLEGAGAEGQNAFTSHDYTGYVQSLPKGNLKLIAKIESQRMVDLLVNDEQLNTERQVVQNERRFRNENNPDGQLIEKLYGLAYQHHSYHWPIIGYEEDLNAAKREQVEAFYKKHYTPDKATIVVVGDVDPDDVFSIVEKFYGDMKASTHVSPKLKPEAWQAEERQATVQVKTPVEKLLIAYHIPNVLNPDLPALIALQNILAGGKSSRLYRKLVDHGIASEVSSDVNELKDPGLFIFGVNLQKNRSAQEALKAIDSELKTLSGNSLKDEEIERAIAQYKLSFFSSQLSNNSKARFLGFYETAAGDFNRGIELLNALKHVNKSSIQRVLKTYFSKTNRTIVFGKPTT